jgi:hypothetical protein
MGKILKVADGAFFVPSYSDQTILRAYSTATTIQSFGSGDQIEESKEGDLQQQLDQKPPLTE